MKRSNPFPLSNYVSSEYFCDREVETDKVLSAIESIRNVAIISNRRIGKTSLIKHVAAKLEKEKLVRFIYIDIMPTAEFADFVRVLGNAVVKTVSQNRNFVQRISGLLTSLRAKLAFDPETGIPSLEFDLKTEEESKYTLEKIFEFLSKEKEKYVIAIDEFQQILNYPESKVEAILRSQIQSVSKDVFIFSGSHKHMMISMFASYAHPFYQSSDILYLDPIETDVYTDFICEKFHLQFRTIDAEHVRSYVEYYNNHTFYVQYFFNRLFEQTDKKVLENDFLQVRDLILKEREAVFYSYKNLLTDKQFQFMLALAKEEGEEQITSGTFIKKYDLPFPSTIKNIAKVLLDKEMIYRNDNIYRVYDVFFEKWMKQTF